MKNAIIISLCCLSLIANGVCCFKFNSKVKSLEENITYLEATIEALAAVQAIPESKTKTVYIEQDNSNLEARVQGLEYENRVQQSKINDVERNSFLTGLKVNEKEYHHGDFYNTVIKDDTNMLKP